MPALWGRLPRPPPSFMNIACTACSARYGVADEKLIGKRVKITCKRCGAVLIVDGNVSPPAVSVSTSIAPGPGSGRPGSSRAPKPAPAARPPDPPFMVAFPDGRQEQGDVAQIVRWHRSGQLAGTLVWREGMDDWKNPWDVGEIAAAFRKMGYARPTPAPTPAARPREDEETTRVADSGPMQSALFDDEEATQVVDSSQFHEKPLPSFGSSPGEHSMSEEDEAATNVARSPLSSPEAAPAPAARRESTRTQKREPTRSARRESTRPRRETTRGSEPARRRESRVDAEGGPDLFAQQAHAGSEADQAAQAEQMMAAAQALQDSVDDGPRLTGARNENSVLFSLDALMQKELRGGGAGPAAAAPPRRSQRNEEALLMDPSPLLAGGGGITPALSAPDFTAPISAPPPRFSPAPFGTDDDAAPPKRSKGVLVMIVLIALGGIGGIGFATGRLQPLLAKVGLMAPPAESAAPEAAPAKGSAAERTAASAAPEASAATDASAAPAGSASAAPAAPPTGTATTMATAPATGAAPVAAAPGVGGTPRSKEKEPPKEKEAPPAPTGFGAGAAFDAQAAKTALGGAAANASSCKEPGGPTGTGRVSITFAASGRPTSVAVTGDLAGTTVGSCVARLFRGARVPAFSGEPVTVSKTFSVQ
jgi:predicted Zn finger-like uncharacterized protein